MTMDTYRIAVIPGDGIGKETVPEGLRVLEAVGRRFDIAFQWREFKWDCDHYVKHGRMMPEVSTVSSSSPSSSPAGARKST